MLREVLRVSHRRGPCKGDRCGETAYVHTEYAPGKVGMDKVLQSHYGAGYWPPAVGDMVEYDRGVTRLRQRARPSSAAGQPDPPAASPERGAP